jgi:TatD DNase family protein
MTFTDTHCHIHEASYEDNQGAYERALAAGVGRMIMVGTDEASSQDAVLFARAHDRAWATLGLHPHDATRGPSAVEELRRILESSTEKIVAIGEVGLDYYYDNSPRDKQLVMLRAQIELALEYSLPIVFHVREAFDDFWPLFDSYQGIRGVLHSFTDSIANMQQAIDRELYIGVNGIATFAKDRQEIYAAIPPSSLIFETDAPYLTPVPHRGTINEPAFIPLVAQHIANLQSISLQELSRVTEANATHLFSI